MSHFICCFLDISCKSRVSFRYQKSINVSRRHTCPGFTAKKKGTRSNDLNLISFPVVGQDYQSEILSEHVILANDVLFKCSIPSFVSDFVQVEAWLDSEANAHYPSTGYGNFG